VLRISCCGTNARRFEARPVGSINQLRSPKDPSRARGAGAGQGRRRIAIIILLSIELKLVVGLGAVTWARANGAETVQSEGLRAFAWAGAAGLLCAGQAPNQAPNTGDQDKPLHFPLFIYLF